MVTRQQIDDILGRTDLVDLMRPQVDLKPAGSHRLKACCPFHDEKTPSFVVYSDKQDYHCFGCGAHGTAIDWIMHRDGLRYWDAVRQLARDAGIELDEHPTKSETDADPQLELLAWCARWFQEQLIHHPQSTHPRHYLSQRGVSAAMQHTFAIGYAPPGWDNLVAQFAANPQQLTHALQLGLIKAKKNTPAPRSDGHTSKTSQGYDAFRDRLIFPIHNAKGAVVGFGGRSLHQGQEPKYLNSAESPIFAKGTLLYGEYQARTHGSVKQWLIVEGYTDVIAMQQYGFHHTVACLGTSLTAQQLSRLIRHGSNICFIFDGDNAGRQAAIRAMQLCREHISPESDFSFLLLPQGEDPDSLLQTGGAKAMQHLIAHNAQPWSAFFLEWLFAQANRFTIEGKTKLSALADTELQPVPNRDYRTLLLRHIKEKLGLGQRRGAPKNATMPRLATSRSHTQKRQETLLLKLLATSIHSRDAWSAIQDKLLPQLVDFSPPLSPSLLQCLALVSNDNDSGNTSALAVRMATALSMQQRLTLEHFTNALEAHHTTTQFENLVRSILRECWNNAGEEQRHRLVRFLSTGLAKKDGTLDSAKGVFLQSDSIKGELSQPNSN